MKKSFPKEEELNFSDYITLTSKKKKYFKKKKSKNNKKIFFYLLAILICFPIYYFIFGFKYFESKTSKINIDKDIDKEKPIHLFKNSNLSLIYDDFAKKLFKENKTVSFDYLDENIYGIKRDYSNFDNIHILFAFNNEYYLLASVTITSILKTANKNSFFHIHIIASKGFEYETMKKLNSLKEKINKNAEFIFYDGSKAEDDFGSHIKNELFGVGEYAKLLGPVLVDKNIDRLIALDAGDLLVQKDLLELYNYPLDDYLVRGVFDPLAPCATFWNIFFIKEGYLNAGVYLYNIKRWREMDIYNDILKFYKYFKYNIQEYIDVNNTNDDQRGAELYIKNCSYFYGKKDQLFEEAKNVVIWHYTKSKIHKGEGAPFLTKQWIKYAEMTGFYEEIKQMYPRPFS